MARPCEEEEEEEADFADAAEESIYARWGSMTAPLLPCLLLSREASSTLFQTPWRRSDGLVQRVRSAALHTFHIFDADVECQLSWLSWAARGALDCCRCSAGELLFFAYAFVLLLGSLMGASSLAAAVGVSALVQRLYFVGCARSLLCFLYDALQLLEFGPSKGALPFLRAQGRSVVLSCLASLFLPKEVLALHMTSCLLFGLLERALRSLQGMSSAARRALLGLRAAAAEQASLAVAAALRQLRPEPPLALKDAAPEPEP